MIRGVTFDWWHTIAETPWPDYDVRMRRLRVDAARDALASGGVLVDESDLYAAYDRLTEHLIERWKTHGDLAAENQVDAFLRFADIRADSEGVGARLREAFGSAILARPPILFPHVSATLARLKREGYKVGLVSNTGRTWGRFLRPLQDELGIGRHFDVRVFSDEVGARKPLRVIFDAALRDLRLPPERVVHVGDDAVADIEGAKGAGMRAIWFDAGFWPQGRPVDADAEIHDHADLFEVLERWKP
ncbi:MAG TPA: HAD family hydrolase [Thermoplasmata archaeon]|nr:HAD family hydrolase [Thermoplasmata archaeon]